MRFTQFRKSVIFAIAVLALISTLVAFFQTPQQASNRSQDVQGKAKRKWRWLAPPPPFLEIVEIKNLDSDNWATDLEIKVKNKSEKPIMLIEIYVFSPDIKNERNDDFGAGFFFGNPNSWDKDGASQDDKLLQPSEEVVLTQKENYKAAMRKGFELASSQRRDLSPSDLRLEFVSCYTIFSDGTKYNSTQFINGPRTKQSFNAPKRPKSKLDASYAAVSFSSFGLAKKKWTDFLAISRLFSTGSTQIPNPCPRYTFYNVPCTGIK